MTGLRVVTPEGTAGIGPALARWALFAIDGPLTLFICGIVTSSVSAGHRRLGDMAGNTYVIAKADAGRRCRCARADSADPRAPLVDQTPGDRHPTGREVRRVVRREPLRLDDLLTVDLDLPREVLRAEADHHLVREGPRLAAAELDVAHREADLLHHLPAHRVLERLPRLHEAGQAGEHPRREVGVAGQQRGPSSAPPA